MALCDVLFLPRRSGEKLLLSKVTFGMFCAFSLSPSMKYLKAATTELETFTLNISLKKQNKHFINNNGNNTTASGINDKLLLYIYLAGGESRGRQRLNCIFTSWTETLNGIFIYKLFFFLFSLRHNRNRILKRRDFYFRCSARYVKFLSRF